MNESIAQSVFATKPDALVVHIDLETTSLDRLQTDIVELAAVAEHSGAVFASIVRPSGTVGPVAAEETRSKAAIGEAVHGISSEELQSAPTFSVAFHRFLQFLEDLKLRAQHNPCSARQFPCGSKAEIILVAHNGFKFDFPVLASQCWRDGVGLSWLAEVKFCDSLDLLHALRPESKSLLLGANLECLKLQCLGRGCNGHRAHRALDDAYKLKDIVARCATWLSTSTQGLVQQAARCSDAKATEAVLATLLNDTDAVKPREASNTPCGSEHALGVLSKNKESAWASDTIIGPDRESEMSTAAANHRQASSQTDISQHTVTSSKKRARIVIP